MPLVEFTCPFCKGVNAVTADLSSVYRFCRICAKKIDDIRPHLIEVQAQVSPNIETRGWREGSGIRKPLGGPGSPARAIPGITGSGPDSGKTLVPGLEDVPPAPYVPDLPESPWPDSDRTRIPSIDRADASWPHAEAERPTSRIPTISGATVRLPRPGEPDLYAGPGPAGARTLPPANELDSGPDQDLRDITGFSDEPGGEAPLNLHTGDFAMPPARENAPLQLHTGDFPTLPPTGTGQTGLDQQPFSLESGDFRAFRDEAEKAPLELSESDLEPKGDAELAGLSSAPPGRAEAPPGLGTRKLSELDGQVTTRRRGQRSPGQVTSKRLQPGPEVVDTLRAIADDRARAATEPWRALPTAGQQAQAKELEALLKRTTAEAARAPRPAPSQPTHEPADSSPDHGATRHYTPEDLKLLAESAAPQSQEDEPDLPEWDGPVRDYREPSAARDPESDRRTEFIPPPSGMPSNSGTYFAGPGDSDFEAAQGQGEDPEQGWTEQPVDVAPEDEPAAGFAPQGYEPQVFDEPQGDALAEEFVDQAYRHEGGYAPEQYADAPPQPDAHSAAYDDQAAYDDPAPDGDQAPFDDQAAYDDQAEAPQDDGEATGDGDAPAAQDSGWDEYGVDGRNPMPVQDFEAEPRRPLREPRSEPRPAREINRSAGKPARREAEEPRVISRPRRRTDWGEVGYNVAVWALYGAMGLSLLAFVLAMVHTFYMPLTNVQIPGVPPPQGPANQPAPIPGSVPSPR